MQVRGEGGEDKGRQAQACQSCLSAQPHVLSVKTSIDWQFSPSTVPGHGKHIIVPEVVSLIIIFQQVMTQCIVMLLLLLICFRVCG